jgi:hypothetical protein
MKAKQKEPTEKSTGQSSQLNWRHMNRKQRRDLERKIQSADLALQLVHPDAAGIDIGNESHYVAVPPDRDSQPVQRFGCTTAELRAMADWLKQCRIRTVAMQSTSVYWIAVYDVLEQAGLEWKQYREAFHSLQRSRTKPSRICWSYTTATTAPTRVATRRAHKSAVKRVAKNKC